MDEHLAVSQHISTSSPKETLVTPLLYLSSAEAGWEGLVAQAFHEPMELEGGVGPATSDISLILFMGGGMLLGQRHGQGSWKEVCIRQGDSDAPGWYAPVL